MPGRLASVPTLLGILGEGDASRELRKKLAELSQKTKTLEAEMGKKKQHIETADTRIQEFTKLVKEKDGQFCL